MYFEKLVHAPASSSNVENDDIADKLHEMDDENEIRFKLKIVSGDSDDGNSDEPVEDNPPISNPAPAGGPAHSQSPLHLTHTSTTMMMTKAGSEFTSEFWCDGKYCENTFNTFSHAMVALMELIVVNNWHMMTMMYTEVTSRYARIYFVLYFTAVVIVMNVLTTFVLEAFIS